MEILFTGYCKDLSCSAFYGKSELDTAQLNATLCLELPNVLA